MEFIYTLNNLTLFPYKADFSELKHRAVIQVFFSFFYSAQANVIKLRPEATDTVLWAVLVISCNSSNNMGIVRKETGGYKLDGWLVVGLKAKWLTEREI